MISYCHHTQQTYKIHKAEQMVIIFFFILVLCPYIILFHSGGVFHKRKKVPFFCFLQEKKDSLINESGLVFFAGIIKNLLSYFFLALLNNFFPFFDFHQKTYQLCIYSGKRKEIVSKTYSDKACLKKERKNIKI